MRMRRFALRADGVFLVTVGGSQVVFELIGHFTGGGPLGAMFLASPYTLGWFEAHGLALLIGLLLLAHAGEGGRVWHRFALAVHALLGGANIIFWSSFRTFESEPLGIAATTCHFLFVGAHAICLRRTTAPLAHAG
jgi:hypothetical protein